MIRLKRLLAKINLDVFWQNLMFKTDTPMSHCAFVSLGILWNRFVALYRYFPNFDFFEKLFFFAHVPFRWICMAYWNAAFKFRLQILFHILFLSVVYFDQWTGASQAVRRSKSSFSAFKHIFKKKCKKKGK